MQRSSRPRVFLDGYNLALDQGTGVATYARNLSFGMARLGFETGVLYGTRASPSRDALIREIAFFDERVGSAPQWLQAIRRGYRLIGSPGGETAARVPARSSPRPSATGCRISTSSGTRGRSSSRRMRISACSARACRCASAARART